MKRLFAAFAVPVGLIAGNALAATNLVSPVQSFTCTNQVATALAQGTGAFTCSTVTAAMFGSSITGGTVFGNATGAAAAPSFTAAPILGVPGTTSGTLELSNSAGGDVVLATGGNTTSYTLAFPTAAPTANGQALTATTGGVASWSTIATAKFVTASKTTSYQVATATDDATRFDNTGASAGITFTVPTAANTTAGDNWCFSEIANQTVTVAVNSTQSIIIGNVTGTTGTGTLVSGGVGSSICLYAVSTTTFNVTSSDGSWTQN